MVDTNHMVQGLGLGFKLLARVIKFMVKTLHSDARSLHQACRIVK